ncbi:MAG: hypothetical protein ABIN89_27335 [Chitinophagaceae bacterium]
MRSSEVIAKARTYVENLFPKSKKIKWYWEENLQGVSIEAKINENKKTYSIKFDTLGALHDVELTQKFLELAIDVQQNITNYFQNQYDRYKIRKIQIQWIGDPDVLRSLIKKEETNKKYTTRYEIEFSGRKNKDLESYESLFDDGGKHMETKQIITRNLNHLIY